MSPQYWVFFWNFESEKFSGETKNFQAKIKIGQAELMNGQVFKSTFRTLELRKSLTGTRAGTGNFLPAPAHVLEVRFNLTGIGSDTWSAGWV